MQISACAKTALESQHGWCVYCLEGCVNLPVELPEGGLLPAIVDLLTVSCCLARVLSCAEGVAKGSGGLVIGSSYRLCFV